MHALEIRQANIHGRSLSHMEEADGPCREKAGRMIALLLIHLGAYDKALSRFFARGGAMRRLICLIF